MLNRITRPLLFMEVAFLFSKRATCGRLQVGAVIVDEENRIICTGYNGPPAGEDHCSNYACDMSKPCTRSLHAEQNAILYAAKTGLALKGKTLFVTHSPCTECAKLIVGAGISEVVYAIDFRSQEGLRYLITHDIQINRFDYENERQYKDLGTY